MGIAIVIVFALVAVFCYLEDKIPLRQKTIIYVLFGIILIILPAIREVGLDPDSENYKKVFLNSDAFDGDIEFSYILLSKFFNLFTNDVHIIFLFYALFGVALKMLAIKQFSEYWFLPLIVYMSYTYTLHEFAQIRTGVMSGLFLLALRPIAERKLIPAFLIIAVGMFFHTSALILFPLLFFDNKELDIKRRLFWLAIIPVAYMLYGAGTVLLVDIPIPYIEERVLNYQRAAINGNETTFVNVVSPLQLFTTMLYLYLMFFYDTIKSKNPYFPLMMKIFGLAIFAYVAFAFLPVMAQRICYLLRVVTIFLYANIVYTIKPRWVGVSVVVLIAFIYLNYSLPYISFELFWSSK